MNYAAFTLEQRYKIHEVTKNRYLYELCLHESFQN